MTPTTICERCAHFEDKGQYDKICRKYERNIADTIVVECDYYQGVKNDDKHAE